jgi:hypothetical protein
MGNTPHKWTAKWMCNSTHWISLSLCGNAVGDWICTRKSVSPFGSWNHWVRPRRVPLGEWTITSKRLAVLGFDQNFILFSHFCSRIGGK